MAPLGLAFRPRSPLFFRENRAFSIAGSGGVGRSDDPSPAVFYGAIRTRYLVERGIGFQAYASAGGASTSTVSEAHAAIGTPTKAGALRIKGPFVLWDDEWYFPPPANGYRRAGLVAPSEAEQAQALTDLAELGVRPLALGSDADDEVDGRWVSWACLVASLLWPAREEPEIAQFFDAHEAWDRIDMEDLFVREPRFGHRRDPITQRPMDEHLFSLETLRAVDAFAARIHRRAGWGVVVEGLAAADAPKGPVWLGGRSRRCDLEYLDSVPSPLPSRAVLESVLLKRSRCTIYLATPALFAAGWIPPPLPGLTLVSAAVGHPRAVGGWDLASARPRRSRLAAPAGTVYFFEGMPKEGWPMFLDRMHFGASVGERSEAGFGVTVVGAW